MKDIEKQKTQTKYTSWYIYGKKENIYINTVYLQSSELMVEVDHLCSSPLAELLNDFELMLVVVVVVLSQVAVVA
jgi:hypothetical protein